MKRREIIVRNLTTPHFGCVIFPTLSHSHKPSESTESTRSISPRNRFLLAVFFLVSCYTEYMWILWQIHWIIPPAFQIIWVLVSNDGSWTFFLKGLLMHSWVHTISAFNCPQRAARLSLRRLQSAGAALGATFVSHPLPRLSPCQLQNVELPQMEMFMSFAAGRVSLESLGGAGRPCSGIPWQGLQFTFSWVWAAGLQRV